MEGVKKQPRHLAWHETLEVHELVSMQSTALMKMKSTICMSMEIIRPMI